MIKTLAVAAVIALSGPAAAGDSYGGSGRERAPSYGGEGRYGGRHDGEYTGGRVGGWYQQGYYDELCDCRHHGRWRD